METVNAWLESFERWFEHRHAISIALGLIVGMVIAQALKFPLSLFAFDNPRVPDERELPLFRWCVRAVGFIAGALVTWRTWPNGGAWAFALAVGGLVSPAYHVGMLLVRRRWPWLAVTPPPPKPEDVAAETFRAAIADTHTPGEHAAADHEGLDGGEEPLP